MPKAITTFWAAGANCVGAQQRVVGDGLPPLDELVELGGGGGRGEVDGGAGAQGVGAARVLALVGRGRAVHAVPGVRPDGVGGVVVEGRAGEERLRARPCWRRGSAGAAYSLWSSPAHLTYSSPALLAAATAWRCATARSQSTASCWSAVRDGALIAATRSSSSSAWASVRPQVSTASASPAPRPWRAMRLATACSWSRLQRVDLRRRRAVEVPGRRGPPPGRRSGGPAARRRQMGVPSSCVVIVQLSGWAAGRGAGRARRAPRGPGGPGGRRGWSPGARGGRRTGAAGRGAASWAHGGGGGSGASSSRRAPHIECSSPPPWPTRRTAGAASGARPHGDRGPVGVLGARRRRACGLAVGHPGSRSPPGPAGRAPGGAGSGRASELVAQEGEQGPDGAEADGRPRRGDLQRSPARGRRGRPATGAAGRPGSGTGARRGRGRLGTPPP